jgi:4-amino-4-deoxy-L-arabinose transferase-like glycosyltransferase
LRWSGGWAYFANLHLSLLEGSEGLYAGIAGEMGRRREFFDLTYHDVPYFNKPPLFFWLLNLSTSIWGDHEVALRLPGSLAAVGTIVLTYVLGARLVSPTAGFWAALVVATSHVFLWYGRRVLFDSTLTFLVTLALFAWIQVQLLGRSSRWYLLAFVSMALGAMLKEMHGFFLPLLVMALYAAIQRDTRMLKDRYFWAGLAVAVAMMGAYAQMLGARVSAPFSNRQSHRIDLEYRIHRQSRPGHRRAPALLVSGDDVGRLFPLVRGASVGAALALGPTTVSCSSHGAAAARLGAGPLHGVQLGDTQTGALFDDDRARYRLDDRVLLSPAVLVGRGLCCDGAPCSACCWVCWP